MAHVDVLERDAEGRAIVVDSQLQVTVASVQVRLRFSYDEPRGLRWTLEDGDLRSLDGSWRFEDRGDGHTMATYSLEIDVSRRLAILVRTVRGPLRSRVEALLRDRPPEALKARAEGRA
jgi:ribosome-associated toxin RatA of RatAB toxin-antitoxin module